ncbi:DegT/DnrJ/EryC1/StrS family aminotransferase [Stappia sp. BW2]|uniref:DegT/DnrJ/EryC1/StrS family aminotransferase n=1 Tax=Stappia sp. BW2 TaxID=2592622 RepID=UPI0011DEE5D3|nr:DegT/DnrJ/EryC1/StrS family aminotransferase [Stappia sp. BW2]TYC79826.1 DegT/DnrJ/EryC1/StrS family aminotransferase [Stappia sp. BW2]
MTDAIKPITLAEDTISQQELSTLCEWILEGNRLTKSAQTIEFEQEFSDWIGSKHAVFTNSGSSSNLLMIASLKEAGRLRSNKVVAASVSWVTTIAPLMQLGLEVFLCDCDEANLGLNLVHLEEICEKEKPSALILCHVLGHANHMNEILDICKRHDVILLEDSCEALGSEYKGKKLGTIGATGSFSFYYGHHISTIEGGMVVTDDSDLHQVMLSLRSHGWSRDLSPERRDALTSEYEIDEFRNLYTFYYPGYNLRSTDLQAFIGRSQLKKIDKIIKTRSDNFACYAAMLPDYFQQISNTSTLSSFAYGTFVKNRLEVFEVLKAASIECRPLICGNIARHPFWLKTQGALTLANADKVHDYGIYLPNHHNITRTDIERIVEIFTRVAIPT